jgi:hypothetical protein
LLFVIAAIARERISIFRGRIHPVGPVAAPAFQHPGDTQVLIEFGPVDAHGHDLEIRALFRRGALEPRIPVERCRDLSSIYQRHDKLSRGELDRARMKVADVNFQSGHSTLP